MNKIISWVIGIVAVLAIVIASVALVGSQSAPAPRLGGVTTGTPYPHGIQVGLPTLPPTNIASILASTCAILGADTSQAASTTKPYDCAVSGITSSFGVTFAQFSSSTLPVSNQGPFIVEGSKASTTAGFLTLLIRNNGVAGALSATGFGSSTSYIAIQTQ